MPTTPPAAGLKDVPSTMNSFTSLAEAPAGHCRLHYTLQPSGLAIMHFPQSSSFERSAIHLPSGPRRVAEGIIPSAMSFRTDIWLVVSVPVLSEQMTVVQPSVSTDGSFLHTHEHLDRHT